MKKNIIKMLKFIPLLTICLVLLTSQYVNAEESLQETTETTVLSNFLDDEYIYTLTIEPFKAMGLYKESYTHTITNSNGTVVFKVVQVTDWELLVGSYVTFISGEDTVYTTSPYTSTSGGADVKSTGGGIKYRRNYKVYDGSGKLICDKYFYTMLNPLGFSTGGIE